LFADQVSVYGLNPKQYGSWAWAHLPDRRADPKTPRTPSKTYHLNLQVARKNDREGLYSCPELIPGASPGAIYKEHLEIS
jgi:hypothetical protein